MGSAASSLPPLKTHMNRPPRAVRPNLKQIHALPLPINIYALPPLIPHNPISVLQIALTFLTQLVVSPKSHPQILYQGFLSPETHSVHVLDEVAIRIFWERGFFGKGSLSRSEPTWLEREKKKKGLGANETSEGITRKRREARKVFKKERARKETEAIENKLVEEGRTAPKGDNVERSEADPKPGLSARRPTRASTSTSGVKWENHNQNTAINENGSASPNQVQKIDRKSKDNTGNMTVSSFGNEEHLQLCPEESFFLVYGLGVLQIRDSRTSEEVSTDSLLAIFRQFSYFPPRQPMDLHPDDPFLVSYVAYHHFRSLGWVVRPGIKFGVDYLLYHRGPVFSHAEFAVLVLPAYTHPHWHSNPVLSQRTRKNETKSWWWLHCVNRVQSQVRKSLILVYVEIPPPSWIEISSTPGSPRSDDNKEGLILRREEENITAMLKRYKIREMAIRRWTPNRSRD